jgi:hypothetical protein
MNSWTGAPIWLVGHNFKNVTGSPVACNPALDGLWLALQRLGTTDGTILPGGQAGYAGQGGYRVSSAQQTIFYYATASWKFSATVPTLYLVTLRFASAPTGDQYFYGGVDGANGGWYLEAHPTNGVRLAVGSGSGYTNTAYVGGTSIYDGQYHTMIIAIDDAGSRAKLHTAFGAVESTGIAITSGNAICTVGGLAALGPWTADIDYLLSFRGENASAYTDAATILSTFEARRG